MLDKIGLVLSGGGAKGAYEIGVYKALSAMGAVDYIDAVAGTSVGALNAVLLDSRGAEYAEKIWNSLKITDMLHPDKQRFNKLPTVPDYSDPDYVGIKPDNIVDSIVLGGMNIFKSLKKDNVLTDFMKDGLPFTQEKLGQIIDEHVDFSRIYRKMYIVCTDSHGDAKYFELNKYPYSIQKKIVLASSALPFVYTGTDGVEIYGTRYFDGGISGNKSNTPISCLYNNGYRSIIAVHLKYDADLTSQYKMRDADIINIIPSQNLGGTITGTLNLNNKKVQIDIEMGYRDTIGHMNEIRTMINNL
ncbi:MAG: patatin-like phospholipase family protein [Ruminococcus flavefaciens]|nr:patatin-like phospholipase family protein [Ruminococcus flavefaciens]